MLNIGSTQFKEFLKIHIEAGEKYTDLTKNEHFSLLIHSYFFVCESCDIKIKVVESRRGLQPCLRAVQKLGHDH